MLCPDCSNKMVTGSNTLKSRGYTRYYHCGTYQRKGPVTCKRNPAPKDRIEAKILDVFINELTQLLEPGTLEFEIDRFVEKANKELTSQISEIEGGIKYIEKRINHLKETVPVESAGQGISEMATEKEQMEKQLNELKKQLKRSEVGPQELEALRYIIRDTSRRIKIEPPDIQWNLLKKFILSIRLDKSTNNYKMNLVVRRLSEMDSLSAPVLLERVCYFVNPFGSYSSTVDKSE